MNVYDFSVTAQDGSQKSLADYEGDVLLIPFHASPLLNGHGQYEGMDPQAPLWRGMKMALNPYRPAYSSEQVASFVKERSHSAQWL